MLERFESFVNSAIEKQEKHLMLLDVDVVQGYFEMQDVNKWLKFNAVTEEQIENANRFEEHLQSLIKKLYVPDYQLENV